ncbi:MAG: histone deacetylase family protein [Acidimicrobiales bacterium]
MLFVTHEGCLDHEAGRRHPERPDRLRAVWAGLEQVDLGSEVVLGAPTEAPMAALARVHDRSHIERLLEVDAAGGGRIDPDTRANSASLKAARLAAGAGLAALEVMDRGEAEAAFCAVRPPGHHATRSNSMGFCLLNNVAVVAMALADRGERVLVFDYDAHHGNGTQDVFYGDPRVLFVSVHQWPFYPGSGSLDERGSGEGAGTTINIPMPAGATGDRYRQAWDEVIAPVVDSFGPTWLLISAGFDAHAADPLTDMGLSSGDFADLTLEAMSTVGPGRTIAFLEGGYDLEALRDSTSAVVNALVGVKSHPESPTSGGPGREVVAAASEIHLSG